MSNLISLMPVFLNIVELNLNLCLGIATENLTMKRFSFSIRRRNILSVIYVTKSYTQGQDYLSTVCRYVKVVYTRLLLNYFDILHLVLLNKLLIFLQLLFELWYISIYSMHMQLNVDSGISLTIL